MSRMESWKNWFYIPLLLMTFFYLLPLFIMLNTGFKSFDEVDLQTMWSLPQGIHFDNFVEAYAKLEPALWNSVRLVIPGAIISAFLGSINGFILSKWKFPGADFIFPFILFGMFIPYQSILIPLVQFMRAIPAIPLPWGGEYQFYGSIGGLILTHVIYGLPITTLTFRNYFASVPRELIEAATIDGADLIGTYRHILLPISIPSFVVVLIWQFTAAWNDFLFAVVLTRPENWPVTVALNNMAGSQIIAWNVQMAGAFLAALPTLLVYIFLGRYFLRGLMAGALKG